jgi:hypothetical protein
MRHLVVARWSFLEYNRHMVRTAYWGWTQRLPDGIQWASSTTLRHSDTHTEQNIPNRAGTHWNPLERAETCCGTLRHSVEFTGVGSHRLRLNKNFTPATHRDTSSDTALPIVSSTRPSTTYSVPTHTTPSVSPHTHTLPIVYHP